MMDCSFDLSVPDAWKLPQQMVKRTHFMPPPATDLFLSPSDHEQNHQ